MTLKDGDWEIPTQQKETMGRPNEYFQFVLGTKKKTREEKLNTEYNDEITTNEWNEYLRKLRNKKASGFIWATIALFLCFLFN